MSVRIAWCAALLLTASGVAAAEDSAMTNVPLPSELLAPQAKVEVAAGVCFLEGPAVDAEGNVFFSDIAGNRILRRDPQGLLRVFRADSGRTNGNTFDASGRLISCEGDEMGPGGRRRVVRTDIATGEMQVLTDRYQNKRYNSPNDVVVDRLGRIWFTDPLYSADRSSMELDHESVYRIDPDGDVTRVITQPDIGRPNGLAITPDGKTLYVVDSDPSRPDANRIIWAFEIADDGSASNQRKIYDFGRGRGGDGMRLDAKGNLWIAAGILKPRHANETADVRTGVYVVSPEGKLLGRIPIPEDVITNLAFGGPGKRTLYITAGKTLYSIETAVAGYSLYPR
jgi:gluconolactonase